MAEHLTKKLPEAVPPMGSTTAEQVMGNETAHSRAKEDYSQYADFARMSAQLTFAANGGAALAMLKFLTDFSTSPEANSLPEQAISYLSVAAACYLLGLLLCVFAVYFLSLAKKYFGHGWEDNAITGIIDFDSHWTRTGIKLERIGFGLLTLSAIAFAPGSAFAVVAYMQVGFSWHYSALQ